MELLPGQNVVIQGDNLEALRQLRGLHRGTVKCVYIDPPYNNKEDYEYYVDDRAHEEWLHELEQRLEIIFDLLRPDGSLWISIDDREMHYLKVACDRLFGRDKFVASIVWQHRKTRENRRVFSFNHEYLLVYAKDPSRFAAARNTVPLSDDVLSRYKNPDGDPRGPWQSVSANVQAGHATPSQFYVLVAPNGNRHEPPTGRCWVYSKEKMSEEVALGNISFGRDGSGVPRIKKFLNGVSRGLTPQTLWTAEEVGTTLSAKRHILKLFPGEPPFDTPKPEELIARVLQIATNPGDTVLDAYLGSGTTAAVAHKMGRSYLGIELDVRAARLSVDRLRQVVEGEEGGISSSVKWAGGGGFAFVSLDGHRLPEVARTQASGHESRYDPFPGLLDAVDSLGPEQVIRLTLPTRDVLRVRTYLSTHLGSKVQVTSVPSGSRGKHVVFISATL